MLFGWGGAHITLHQRAPMPTTSVVRSVVATLAVHLSKIALRTLGTVSVASLLVAIPGESIGAQTPPNVSVSPAPGTHTTSATFNVTMSACADNQMQDFQSISVNGTQYTALGSGDGSGGFGCAFSGSWGANVQLNNGLNNITAQVCDDSFNCGSASTTIILDSIPPMSILVSANTATMSVPEATNASATFVVSNTGTTTGTANISVSCPGVNSCSVSPTSQQLAGSSTLTATVSFLTGTTPGTSGITVTANYSESPSTTSSASTQVTTTAVPPTLMVTPDGAPMSVGAGEWTATFNVSNTGRNQETVQFSASCGVFSDCAPSTSSKQIPAGETDLISVTFLVDANQVGATSTVSLSAEACDAPNVCGSDDGSYNVTFPAPPYNVLVTPSVSSITTRVSTLGIAIFTVKNTGGVDGTLDVSVICVGMASPCKTPSGATSFTVFLTHGSSQVDTVVFTTQSTPTTGSASLSAFYSAAQGVSSTGTTSVFISANPPSISVTPDNSPLTVSAGTWPASFNVANTGADAETVSLTDSCGAFTNCTMTTSDTLVRSSFTLNAGATLPVLVSFTVASSQAGTSSVVSLTANGSNSNGTTSDSGSYNVTFPTPTQKHGVIVTASPPTVTLPSRIFVDSAIFIVHDTSANAGPQTYTLTPTCSGVVGCSGTKQLTLNDSAQQSVVFQYTVAQSGTTGAITLTAVSSVATGSGSQTVNTTPGYALSVIPLNSSQSVAKGDTGRFQFTIQNTTSNSDTTHITASIVITSCQTPTLTNCQAPTGSVILGYGDTAPETATFVASQTGVGFLNVNATGTVPGGATVLRGFGSDSVSVTVFQPGTIAVTPVNDTVPATAPADLTVSFTISSTETKPDSVAYHISCTSAATQCHDSNDATDGFVGSLSKNGTPSAPVTVSYHVTNTIGSSGTVTLSAHGVTNPNITGSGTRTVIVSNPLPLIVNTRAANPGPAITRDQCVTIAAGGDAAYECGDLRLAEVLPATTTMNKTRAPTLVYNSRQGAPIELIGANVSVGTGLGVTELDATVQFISNQSHATTGGVTMIFPWSAANNNALASRIVVPVDTRTQGLPTPLTGVYNYVFQVVAKAGATVVGTATDTGTAIVVDRTQSQFGRGWWLDGLEQLSTNTPTPSSTKLWIGGDGNARVYTNVASTNTWTVTPTLDRPDTLTFAPDSGLWKRHLRNGAFVEFDNTGKHIMTQNIDSASATVAAHQTVFNYNPSSQLTTITLPVASGAGQSYTLSTTKDANGNMLTATITSPAKTGQPRIVALTSNIATNQNYTILDADSSTEVFPYDATSGRITSRIDRLGHTTTFDYETRSGALAHTTDVLTTGDPTVVHSFCAGEIVGMDTISGPTEACPTGPIDTALVRTLYNGPKLGDTDIVAFSINQFGAPTRILDPFATATIIDRLDTRFPLLATRVRRVHGSSTLSSDSTIYNSRGLPQSTTTLVDTLGTVLAPTQYTWHPVFDRVVRVVAADGEIVASSYDAIGRRVADTTGVTPSTKRVTSYFYTSSDEVDSVRAPITVAGEPSTTSFTYDAAGNLTTSKTPIGFVTTEYRDALGQIDSTKAPIDSGANPHFRTTTVLRDVFGRDTTNITVGAQLAPFAQTFSVTVDSLVVATQYDLEGRVTSVRRHVNPNPNNLAASMITVTTYDQVGRPIAERAPDGFADSTHYGDGANPTTHLNRNRTVVTTFFDALNRPTTRATSRLTDSSGVDHGRQIDVMTYDAAGRLARAANNFAIITRGYTAAGLVSGDSELVANGDLTFGSHLYSTQSTYDLVGHRTSLVLPGPLETPMIRYFYDEFGELDSLNSLGLTVPVGVAYAYDARGRLDTVRFGNGILDTRQYDGDDRLVHRVQANAKPHNCSTLPIDPACWRPAERAPTDSIEAVTLSRNAMGQVTQVNGFLENTTSGYTGLGALSWFSRNNARFTTTPDNEGFEVDPMANVFHDVASDGSQDQVTRTYESTTGRLKSVLPTGSNFSSATSAMIGTYDNSGNQVTLSHVHTTTATNLVTNGQVAINLASNAKMTYDALGHLRFLNELADEVDTLKLLPVDSATATETRYDALGRRVWVQTQHVSTDNCGGDSPECSVQRFMWDGSTLLGEIRMPLDTMAENDSQPVFTVNTVSRQIMGDSIVVDSTFSWTWGAVSYLHGAGDQGIDVPAVTVRVNGGTVLGDTAGILFPPFPMYVHADWKGTITALSFDNGGPLINGNPAATPPLPTDLNAQATAYGLRGGGRLDTTWMGSLNMEQQDETGFQYRRNRYYDPQQGRFTQEDPIGLAGGMNLYGFAGGDPVNFSDPFGLCPVTAADPTPCGLTGAAIGGAAGAGIGIAITAGCASVTVGICAAGGPMIIGATAGLGAAIGGFVNTALTFFNTRDGDLPAKGEPGTSAVKDNGKGKGQIRDYGKDGKAKTDYDFGHDHTGEGDPHAHDWDWTKKPERQPPRAIRPNEKPPQE